MSVVNLILASEVSAGFLHVVITVVPHPVSLSSVLITHGQSWSKIPEINKS
jgi:hypothetical protein